MNVEVLNVPSVTANRTCSFQVTLSEIPDGVSLTPESVVSWLADSPAPGDVWLVVDVYGDDVAVCPTRDEAIERRDEWRREGYTAKVVSVPRNQLAAAMSA